MPRVAKYEENEEPIAGYRLVSFLGQGQFGEVWKAVESTTGKLVAIKIIDLSHSNSALKELKALNLVKNLNHPHLIPIFTARLKDKNNREIPLHKTEELKGKGVLRELVIAMGLGDKSLSARLKEFNPDGTDPVDFRGLPVDELLGYMQGAAKGIDYLNKADHGLGIADGPIVHCDIKPDNMMIVAGEVAITDCGVAVIITPDVRQTKAAGSPAYSAPELTGNKPVPGTDQYALAISYYELRTGHLPFDEQMGQLSIMLAHAEGRLDFTSPMITEEERQVLKWATAVRPKERYALCFDMVKQLERAVEGLPPIDPGRIGLKSGVVPSPRSRLSAPPPLDSSVLRSTPNFTPRFEPPSEPKRKTDPVVSFELPAPREELRGTVIPNSDRYLPTNEPGLALPAVPADVGPSAAIGTSQAEIVMPAIGDDRLPDDEGTATSELPAPPTLEARTPDRWSPDISRPQISIDGDDPMGARAGTVELDPEIAKIIKGARAPSAPSIRLPSTAPSPAVQTQRAPALAEAAPEAVPGKRSTQFPRETPAEEEAKSLPPWMKEAKAAESQRNRAGSQASLPATNWKEADAKAGGGIGVKLILGGVLVAGIAGGGAYFSGLLGGKGGGTQASNGVDDPARKKGSDTGGTQTSETKADPARIDAIAKLVAAKTDASLAEADRLIEDLPKESAYADERKRLAGMVSTARSELAAMGEAAKLDQAILGIDAILKTVDAKADPAAATTKIAMAESLIGKLPTVLPPKHVDKRTEWAGTIGKAKLAMATTEEEREFLQALADLETRPLATFVAQAKKIYGQINLADRQKKLGQRLILIGDRKEEFRGTIIDFLKEDAERFTLLLPGETDRLPVIRWRTAQLLTLADTLRAMLAGLAKGTYSKESPEVAAAHAKLDELKERKKAIAAEFGTHWNDKHVPDEIAKIAALATVWSDARKGRGEGIRPLRELVQAGAPPDLALAMAMEYLRIGIEKSETIDNLRLARDKAAKWSTLKADEKKRIDDLFQAGLAIRVRNDLATATDKPKWDDLAKLLDGDAALGWKAAVEAERRLETGGAVAKLDADATADATQADRAAFLAYLAAAGRTDAAAADEMLALYRTPPPLLAAPFRRKRAASVLAAGAIVATKEVRRPESVLDGDWKPYEADAKALARLKKADELDGKDHPEWAIHLYLLADASRDADAARAAARRIALDDAKLPVADLPFAMAYFRSRAADAAADQATRVEAHAATARIANRLMEATFDPKEDAREREKKLLPKIEALAEAGLAISGGREADQMSLRLSALRSNIVLVESINNDWFAKVRPELDRIVRGLPDGHADMADARSYRAFVTLMRFSSRGDLSKSTDESEKRREWDAMLADAGAAVKLDPESHYGHRVLGLTTFSAFPLHVRVYSPPKARQLVGYHENRDAVIVAATHLDMATKTLRARKNFFLWLARSSFLFAAASDFAKAGASTATVREFLQDARLSVRKADEQVTRKRVDEPRLLGCIEEDLAWLGREDPVRTFEVAIRSLSEAVKRPVASALDREQKIVGIGDRARAIVRGVQFGHFPKSRLADADAALDELEAEAAKLADAERTDEIKVELAKGLYWRGMRHLAAENPAEAAKAFVEAAPALRPYIADSYAFCHAHIGEAALADRAKSRDETQRAVDEAIRQLEAAAKATGVERSMGFVPDYLKARRALLAGETAEAKSAFADAHRTIADTWRLKTLRVEDAFALRCLAHEILNVNLGGSLQSRKDLLGELEKAFSWSLTPADRRLVADAMKK